MKNFLRSKKELLRLFVGVSTVMILFLAGDVKAQDHPFLLVTEDMYPELRARANSSPWSDMKTEAINFINNNSYDNSDNGTEKHYMIRNLSMCGALAYILDPANKISYKNKVRDALLNWDDAITSVDNEFTGWTTEVLPGSSFVSSVVAFDIIYNDLTADERNAIIGKFNFVYNRIDRTSWPLNLYGVKGVWNVFIGNEGQALIHINNYKNTINSQVSTDGVGAMGPGYSLSRLGGSSGRGPSKTYSMDIFDFTGYESFYDNPRLIKFYEWLIAGGVSPIKMTTMFGDTFSKDAGNRVTARFYSLSRFSSEAHGQAAWLLKDAGKKFSLEQILFHYILQEQQMPTPEKPKSQIWTDGGAAFWEDNSSDRSLQGVLWNIIGITHAHSHRDVNSIHITAYGENVLRNVGYEGWGSGIDGTFDWNWIHDQARANNVALINNDATGDKKGSGITEGFTGGLFDYASGDGGNCMPLLRGHHQRNFIMVHPQDGKPGYFALIDEINVENTSHKGHILFHPDSANYTTVSANTEYKWTINRYSGHNVYLNIFLATPPSSVSVLNGGLTNPPYVGKYLDSRYASDPSGDISALTILFPNDSTHAKAAMSRVAGSGYTGANINHGSDIIDYAFESDNASVITYNGVSFQGLAALYRTNNNNNSFYFVRKGRSFNDGKVQRKGFESNANATIYIKDKQGKVISSGADVTFYYPGITDVAIDGVSAPIISSGAGWVKINIGTGNHDVLLLAGEEVPPSDTTDPIVVSFTVDPTTVNTDEPMTISYTVTDETTLKQVELYRTTDNGGSPDPDNWNWINTDDTISGTSASGSFTDSISTAGIYWYGLHVIDEAGNRGYEPSPVKVTVNSEITGTSYFVKPAGWGGNDGNTGLSDAQAWATINKVNSHSFQTGDNVFFKCGGIWTGTYVFVDWDGASDNRAVIGAYYGNGVVGVSGDKPVIDGNDIAPADNYDGLITIENREYITVENIHIKRSAGYGVWVYQSNNILVDNIYIKRTYMQGVYFRTSSYCTLQYSDISETCRYGNGSVVAFWDSDHVNVNYNIIHETSNEQIVMNSGREGINFLHSDYSNAIGNVVYDCKGLGIYFDHAQHATAKYNLVYYTGNKAYWRSATKPSPGFVITDEEAQGPSHLSRDITITNNLIANCGGGITLWSGTNNDNDPALINAVIANNIIVEPVSTDGTQRAISLQASSRHSNSVIKNNIFWQSANQIAYVVPDSDLVFSNNLWSQPKASIDTDAQGSEDVYGQVPQLLKTTGWSNLPGGSLKGSDFTLQSTSPAINAGTSLGSPYNQGLNSASTWVNNVSTLNQNDYDNWEIGAFVFADVPIPDIDPTCQSLGYQCCNSCQSGSHSEYNGNCPGQVCCEVCTPGEIIPPSCSDSGTCCATGWICDGGSGENLPGCNNVCCIGGTCAPAPALPSTCQGEGYKCCASCQSGPHSEYDTDCTSGQICCETCPPPPKTEMDNFISALDFPKLVQNLLSLALSIIGSLALLMLIIGGVMYMGSTGDEQKALTAKKIVTYAILGIVLILLSYSITMVLSGILS